MLQVLGADFCNYDCYLLENYISSLNLSKKKFFSLMTKQIKPGTVHVCKKKEIKFSCWVSSW